MKAVVVNKSGKGEVAIIDKEIPKVAYNEILVKIECCGVCHTDLHIANGDFGMVPLRTLGHEGVGKVVEVGAGVTSLTIGDRVSIAWLFKACGTCEYCLEARESLCCNVKNAGFTAEGAMAEYCKIDADYAVKIPENLSSPKASSIICAGVTTYKGIKAADTNPGEWIVIYGCGGLGNLAVQYAKHVFNLKVIAVDISNDKLELAKRVGADIVINSGELINADQIIIEKTKGGTHTCLVTAVSKTAFTDAVNVVKAGGTVVAIGLPPENMDLSIVKIVLNEIKIIGSLVGNRKDLAEALQFAAEGKVNPVVILKPMEEASKVFKDMQEGKILGRIALSFE